MPVAMRTTYQKAEAKYNVTTEFPNLDLHAAAATGNLGLVEYALDHGQPINSVLDGVLPLHAACAGGNVQVVKLLIEHGADVNAPRLPRRYSNDKNRDSSAPIVGTSGSTPLHFAAANGNTDVVSLLLLHGAHANRPDKHGITPEMLARQHGWLECAEVLKQWLVNKDRDLRERPSGVHLTDPTVGSFRERISSFGSDVESQISSTRRRLHVKHSIDNALNKLKSATDTRMQSAMASTPPGSPIKPFGEYTFVPTSPDDVTFDAGARRPSLPHILQPSSTNRGRKTSTPNSTHSPSPRRPRSASNGAEVHEPETTNPAQGKPVVRKLGSKYSLLNLFKKAQAGESVPSSESSQSLTTTSLTAGSALHVNSSPSQPSPLSHTLATFESTSTRSGFRMHRGSDAASSRSVSQQPNTPQSIPRKISGTLAQSPRPELHNALVQDRDWYQRQSRDRSRSTGSGARIGPEGHASHNTNPCSSPPLRFGLRVQKDGRARSGSGSSLGTSSIPGYRGGAVFDDDCVVTSGDSNSARPSILKAHSRTTSSGYVPCTPQGFRALRFDSSSSVSAKREGDGDDLRTARMLRGSSSTGSLGRRRMDFLRRGTTPEMRVSEEELGPESAPAVVTDFVRPGNVNQIESVDDEDEEEYGQPLCSDDSPTVDAGDVNSGLLLRQRGASFASSSQSSLSPIMPNDGYGSTLNTEFPFSINKPPVIEPDFESAVPAPGLLSVPLIGDHRIRGDSVSSTGTSDSHNPQLSASGTTSGSGSETVTTPWFSSPGRDDFLDVVNMSPDQHGHDLDYEVGRIKSPEIRIGNGSTSLIERRPRIPPDINISAISAHAQAEALVQKAQRDILEMATSNENAPATASSGRSPLSAKLAAYGESLALERKLRERMEEERQTRHHKQENEGQLTQQTSGAELFESGAKTPEGPYPRQLHRASGIERQRSLEHPLNRSKSRDEDLKRPSTAEGFASRSVEQTGSFHQSSQSESGLLLSPRNLLSPTEFGRTVDVQENGQELLHSKSASFSVSSPRHVPSPVPPIRSRTPIPDLGDGYLNRIGDTDTELGPDLCRVSTAPLRGAKTATKLTRMGFPPLEQVRTPVANTKRFGAFRPLLRLNFKVSRLQVDDLKKAVKVKKPNRLNYLDASQLTLYKLGGDAGVDSDIVQQNGSSIEDYGDQATKLQEDQPLFRYWPSPPQPRRVVHLVVELPQDLELRRKRQRDEEEDEGEAVARLRNKIHKGTPSNVANAPLYREIVGPGQPIVLNRPYEHEAIPLTLYHAAFGSFKDRCKRPPSIKALKCLFALSECGRKSVFTVVSGKVSISTDWTAIVMDKLDYPTLFDLQGKEVMSKEKRDKIRNKVRGIVQELHEGGFVHGDVRDINVLVDPGSLQSADVMVFLIDFDWAGAAGIARYPYDVNTEMVRRPEGVEGGGLILLEHDLEMVNYL
ncbi:hypothetical protein C0993_003760 [Termitomyces sp. T159_Od127]|nr:hypothetical protein C0993_003760 [Termitomyces sp. T159_Od127]